MVMMRSAPELVRAVAGSYQMAAVSAQSDTANVMDHRGVVPVSATLSLRYPSPARANLK